MLDQRKETEQLKISDLSKEKYFIIINFEKIDLFKKQFTIAIEHVSLVLYWRTSLSADFFLRIHIFTVL